MVKGLSPYNECSKYERASAVMEFRFLCDEGLEDEDFDIC